MHQGITPAVDGLELVVAGGAQRFTMSTQHRSLVHAVAMGGCEIHDVVHAGGGMELLAQIRIGISFCEERLQIGNRHSSRAGIWQRCCQTGGPPAKSGSTNTAVP